SDAEQYVRRDLVEPLVRQPFGGERATVEVVCEQGLRAVLRVSADRGRGCVGLVNLGEYGFDLRVLVPRLGLLLQYEVRSHAPSRELAHALVVFSPVCVRVEVARALVPNVFEKLHEPEGRLRVGRAEAQILIVSSGHLVVEVYVEELSCLPSLRD